MKYISCLLAIFTITIICGTTSGGKTLDGHIESVSPEKDKLAVIVQSDPGEILDPGVLQSLIEIDFLSNWQGDFLERKKIDAILKELKLTKSMSGTSAGMKIGKLLQVDYFVLVTVNKDKVICVVNEFPEATVVSETKYVDQLFEESIAKRIAIHSLKAVNEHKLDKTKVHVSIGSFIYEDPFRQYLNVSDTIHKDLRQRLSKHDQVTLTERLFPTHLLKEYSLNRSGLTKSVNAVLCAPPADVLIFGEFKPQEIQKLSSENSVLDFKVSFISPTGLFDKTVESFSVSSSDTNSVGLKIEKAFINIVHQTKRTLKNRTERRYNDSEYKTFKKLAVELKKSALKSGTPYYNSRYPNPPGLLHEYERALCATENALMLNNQDTELMVQAGHILINTADRRAAVLYHKQDDPALHEEYLRFKAITQTGIDYIENAFLLEANRATRNAYSLCGNILSREAHAKRLRRMLKQIVDTGPNGGWSDHHIRYAAAARIFNAEDFDEQTHTFIDFACNKELGYKPNLTQIAKAFEYITGYIIRHRDKPQLVSEGMAFAEKLKLYDSAAIKGLGHYLHALICCKIKKEYDPSIMQFSKIVDLIPDIQQEYGTDLSRSAYLSYIFEPLREQLFQEKGNLSEVTFKASLKYAEALMYLDKYWSSDLKKCLQSILPELYKREEYQKGYALACKYLANHKNDGNDTAYGHIVSLKNKFQLKLSKQPRIGLSDLVKIDMNKIHFRRGKARIHKLLYVFDKIWIVNSHVNVQSQYGQLYNLSPDSTKAKLFTQIDGMVSNIDHSSSYIGVATIDSGVSFLDNNGVLGKKYTVQNSMLPSNRACAICSDGKSFYVGLIGKYGESVIHQIDSEKNTIKNCQQQNSTSRPFSWIGSRLIEQDFRHRAKSDGTYELEFKRLGDESTVVDHDNQSLFSYKGADLSCVYDLVLWQGLLVFADESGFYISKPKSNKPLCILFEEDLAVYSLCAVDKYLFIGTSKGLFRIDHKTFRRVLEK